MKPYLAKNIIYQFIALTLFVTSCSNNELTKGKALLLVANYYGFGYPSLGGAFGDNITQEEKDKGPSRQTQIAIDKKIDDYGWPPEKYKQLQKNGIISLNSIKGQGFPGWSSIVANVTEDGKKLLRGTRIWKTQTEGSKPQILFAGYTISIKNISISSNAKEKHAEAIINFAISDISPVQQIFSPLKQTVLNTTVYFKLYDDGWKIVDNEQSHLKINIIDNPLHWLGD